jgi:uncharacterized membrane protein
MAQTATRKQKGKSGGGPSPVRRRRAAASSGNGGAPRTPTAKAKKAAGPGKTVATKAATKTAKKALVPKGGTSHLARRLAAKGLKKLAARMLQTGAAAARAAAVRVTENGRDVIQRAMVPSVPVQRSIDVAVPLNVAWQEWMKLESLPEGAHRVDEIERDGDELYGRIDAAGRPDWHAEVIDEREEDSFAWRSVEGSDCAGLITFHRLSDRLTRLELELDVIPTSASEVIALNTPLAQRRAEIELRRFKAHVEFTSPDAYEPDNTDE